MTTYFVSRHPGACDWAEAQSLEYDHLITHLEPHRLERGDTVVGTLPVNLAAEVCKRGAHYIHLSLILPPELRGVELSVDDLNRLDATLEEFKVEHIGLWAEHSPG